MPNVFYSAEAEQDLYNIVRHIGKDNVTAADDWLEQILVICELLATQPSSGERLKTRRSGWIRRHVAGNFLIYYRPSETGVTVLRVAHGARKQRGIV